MTGQGLLQLVLYVGVLVLLVKPLGGFMASVYEGKRTFLSPVLGPVERVIYRVAGIDPNADSDWKRYALAVLLFNFIGFIVVYLLQRLQGVLPLNPQDFGAVSPDSSFNTAVSFATNTNWQGYVGETTMSYLTQMLGLGVQNFVSAASGMAVLVALIRGFARRQAGEIGNFWVDLTRSTLYILLPLSLVLAIVLISQGVVQSFDAYRTAGLLEPLTIEVDGKAQQVTEQAIPLGPAASQVAIKQLGTNGGGFFNANSSHPFENPTPLSNFLEVLAILLIPAALCYTFGRMIGDRRQGWALLAAMLVIFVPLLLGAFAAEQAGNPQLTTLGVDQAASADAVRRQHGRKGNALRHCQLRSLGHGDDRGLEWLGQFNARFVHAARRARADLADAARRGRVRRRRQRAIRHAHVRDRRSIPRGPHGRPDSRIPRQKDRGL